MPLADRMHIALALCLIIATASFARAQAQVPTELWVNQATGDDANPGTEAAPLATIQSAVEQLAPGMTLHIQPTDRHYPGGVDIHVSGKPDAPIVIDGHGSTLTGRRALPLDVWQSQGDGVYSRELRNNAWGMERHWEGHFPLVWYGGEPAKNYTTRDELEPGGFFLYKNRKQMRTDPLHNTLFIRLPEGQTLEQAQVQSVVRRGGIHVSGDHVTVRNLACVYGGTDGFSSGKNKGVRFENVEASYFMDQGASQHGSEVVIVNSHFHNNAGAGVVDVDDGCRVRYENCLIEANPWRGGVELMNGDYEMVNCIIRGNDHKTLLVNRGANVVLRNCLLVAPSRGDHAGLRLARGCTLTIDRCTVFGFDTALSAALSPDTRLTVSRSVFMANQTNFRFVRHLDEDDPDTPMSQLVQLEGNHYEPGMFMIRQVVSRDGERQTRQEVYEPEQYADFAREVGSTTSTLGDTRTGSSDPTAWPAMYGPDGQAIGYTPIDNPPR